MCATLQNSQPMKPFSSQPAEFHHRGAAADGRQFAEMHIAERLVPSRWPAMRAAISLPTYCPICLAAGAMPGTGLPLRVGDGCGVADDENLRMAGHR